MPNRYRKQERKGCGCFSCLIGFLLLVGLGVFLGLHFTGQTPQEAVDRVRDWIEGIDFDWEDYFHEDPFNATGPDDAPRWRNTGGGLDLELVNALDDRWNPFFVQAVQDWENGDPDILSLSTSQTSVDSKCSAIEGKMKVCNGNYGNTGWKGINEVIIQNRVRILSSVAKMNEFYLSGSNDAQKQYTMCHEIGHGFGLPHTDENFHNANTGECMDYSSRPDSNKQPSRDNFIFLQQMYGGGDSVTASALQVAPGDDRRGLRNGKGFETYVTPAFRDIIPKLEAQNDGLEHQHGWRALHTSEHGTIHERELGGGYTVQVYKLLAKPEDYP